MHFLPPETLPFACGEDGHGGISVNADSTLLASVDFRKHCVHIRSIHSTGACIVGTVGVDGSEHGHLSYPTSGCFVRHNGVDTLLITDFGNDRIVEVTTSGVFLRAIAVKKYGGPWGIAYCSKSKVIAVTLASAHAVVFLQYESGEVKSEVSSGLGHGQLFGPRGVTFTADGDCILVVETYNHRVSKFSTVSGAFITHVATKEAHGIEFPGLVVQCEDGSVVVTQADGLVRVQPDRVTPETMLTFTSDVVVVSLCQDSLHNIIVKFRNGNVAVLRDAWAHSSRRAWLCATIV